MSGRLAAFLLAAVTLLVVALSTGGSIYYLILGMMFFMFLFALLSSLVALYSFQFKMDSLQSRVTRGDSVTLRFSVRHLCPIPLGCIRLQLSQPDNQSPVGEIELSVPPFKPKTFERSLNCPHRGQYLVGINRLEVNDVFGLLCVSRKLNRQLLTLEVLPKVKRLSRMDLASGDSGPEIFARKTEDTASPSDIRNYQDGDMLKRVHWKLTMRRRELMVRTYEEAPRPDTLILLDCSPVNASGDQALCMEDALCETACSVALSQLRAGYPVRMPLLSAQPTEISGQSSAEFGRFLNALTALSFDGEYPFEQVITLEMRRLQRTGGIVLITARLTMRIADMALQLHRSGAQVCVCWITETRRAQALELLTRLELQGIQIRRVNPWIAPAATPERNPIS